MSQINRRMQYDTSEEAMEAVRKYEEETNSRFLSTKIYAHGEWYRKADTSVDTNMV